jgi:hypothetical protein
LADSQETPLQVGKSLQCDLDNLKLDALSTDFDINMQWKGSEMAMMYTLVWSLVLGWQLTWCCSFANNLGIAVQPSGSALSAPPRALPDDCWTPHTHYLNIGVKVLMSRR